MIIKYQPLTPKRCIRPGTAEAEEGVVPEARAGHAALAVDGLMLVLGLVRGSLLPYDPKMVTFLA